MVRSLVSLALVGCAQVGEWQPVEVEGGLVYPEVLLDQDQPVRCLLDTGAAFTLLHSDLDFGEEPTLTFGDRDLPLLDVISDPLVDPMLESLNVDCLLGWNSLEPTAFTIDYAGQQMRLTDRREKERRLDLDLALGEPLIVPFLNTRPLPVVEARFQDQRSATVVDTGAQLALLDPTLLADLAEPPPTQVASVLTADGVLPGEVGTLSSIRLGDSDHADVDFVSYDSVQLDAVAEDLEDPTLRGAIGASLLVRYVVTFDDPRGELVLHPYSDRVADRLVNEIRASLTGGRRDGAPIEVRVPVDGAP